MSTKGGRVGLVAVVLLAVCAVAMVVSNVAVSAVGRQKRGAASASLDATTALRSSRVQHTRRTEGLRAAAAISGTYRGRAGYIGDGPQNLSELVGASAVIVYGVVSGNRCLLSSDGKSIYTVYSVAAQRFFKGVAGGGDLHVVVPGGYVTFPEGTSAELDTPGFMRPANGHMYMFFLGRSAVTLDGTSVGDVAYEPVAGPLGVINSVEGRTVFPAGSFNTVLGRAITTAHYSLDAFQDATLAAVDTAK